VQILIKCSAKSKLLLVRPHVEDACGVWDPHILKNINSLEIVLHWAGRVCKANCCQYCASSLTTGLGRLIELFNRRRSPCLYLFYYTYDNFYQTALDHLASDVSLLMLLDFQRYLPTPTSTTLCFTKTIVIWWACYTICWRLLRLSPKLSISDIKKEYPCAMTLQHSSSNVMSSVPFAGSEPKNWPFQ